MTTMVLSHSHITLQFTFIWQLWYCHIHIWLSNLPSYDNYDIVTFTYDSPIYLHITTMILSYSHMTLQFTFIWQLWYCHILIWLQFTFQWQLWYCHIHIHVWPSNLPSYNNYDMVISTYDSSIYLHMTTMILSHSHMTLQFTFI
jgi:hypothetical protein